jgi:hypothetical protein
MSVSDDTSFIASITAAINDSKDNGQEQVSGVVHNTTNDNDDDVSNDDMSVNEDKEMDADMFFW